MIDNQSRKLDRDIISLIISIISKLFNKKIIIVEKFENELSLSIFDHSKNRATGECQIFKSADNSFTLINSQSNIHNPIQASSIRSLDNLMQETDHMNVIFQCLLNDTDITATLNQIYERQHTLTNIDTTKALSTLYCKDKSKYGVSELNSLKIAFEFNSDTEELIYHNSHAFYRVFINQLNNEIKSIEQKLDNPCKISELFSTILCIKKQCNCNEKSILQMNWSFKLPLIKTSNATSNK